jgi:hypothetical protein
VVELVVRAQEGSGPELFKWLSDDPDVPKSASVSAADSSPGDMGIGFDILTIVVPNVIALGQLIVAIATYKASRQGSTGESPQISIGRANTFVLIEGDGSGALRRLTREPEEP